MDMCSNHYTAVRWITGYALGRRGQETRINPHKLGAIDLEKVLLYLLGDTGREVCCPRSAVQGEATKLDSFLILARKSKHWDNRMERIIHYWAGEPRGVRQRIAFRALVDNADGEDIQ